MKKTNPVAWFEIYVNDMDRAAKFYETVLQTTLEDLPMPGEMEQDLQMKAFPMNEGVEGASGALVKTQGFGAGIGGSLIYFSSNDCAVEEGRIEAAGGKVEQSKMSIGQYGFIVLAVDTEGNMFGIHSNQ